MKFSKGDHEEAELEEKLQIHEARLAMLTSALGSALHYLLGYKGLEWKEDRESSRRFWQKREELFFSFFFFFFRTYQLCVTLALSGRFIATAEHSR